MANITTRKSLTRLCRSDPGKSATAWVRG